MYNKSMSSHLYVRSCFSLLESTIKINELVAKAKDLGYQSLALVDHNVLGGAIPFFKAARTVNLKPIIGLSFDLTINQKGYETVLYAKDDEGYLNLMHLSTFLMTHEQKINLGELRPFLAHNIILFPSDNFFFNQDLKLAFETLSQNFSGFYIGLTNNQYFDQKKLNQAIKEISKDYQVKCVALNKTYYLEPDDAEAYQVLGAIKNKQNIKDHDLIIEKGHHFLSQDEFTKQFAEEDLIMSDFLASLCNVKMELEKTALPKYTCPKGINSRDYLVNLAKVGLEKRFKGNVERKYYERLYHELKIIISMHFEDYFLIVYDFILFAKRQGIFVGPGRGSAAGSLVSFCLGITDIDPLKYGLIFERFLNPERVSMPDIDTDFPDNRRDEVIDYVRDKYGIDHVAHIITYGTLQTKQVLRDVARVLNYDKIDSLCKAVPNDAKITLKRAYQESRYFRQKVDLNAESRRLFAISLKLEGLPRHMSTHAAGVVMSLKPLSDMVPLIQIENDLYSTGVTAEYLEELGLIKMDFLGLRNLAIIAEICEDINLEEPFNISRIPLNDPKTFDVICNVQTLGIFQLESAGMQNLIRKMQPRTFEDIALTIALYRPGPMGNIPQFIYNRAHPQEIVYLHEDLRPILASTCGIIVYQEQIMTIARKMAGFSYGKADIMRKAMSKKKMAELEKLENDFIKGCIKHGYQEDLARQIYDLILKFANYGFNKSHSIAYARVAYELTYLKANYPKYFYKALLNGAIGSSTKTYEYISECLRIKQIIKGPSINHSFAKYTIENNALRMPLSIIKNCGVISVEKIVKERSEKGPFVDYESTILRLKHIINKNVFETLIYSGAFDEFGLSHKTMLHHLEDILKKDDLMMSLDNPMFKTRLITIEDSLSERIAQEKDVLGFNFAFNPLLEYKKKYNIDTKILSELFYETGFVKGFGILQSYREYTTKYGEKMCFLSVSDDSGALDLVVQPQSYVRYRSMILEAKKKYIYFEGEMRKAGSCTISKLEVKG